MTTHDTPEAVCAAALDDHWLESFFDQGFVRCSCETWRMDIPGDLTMPALGKHFAPFNQHVAAAILAAMPGWTLVPRVATADWTGSTRKDAEAARLRAAIQAVLDDAESQHPGGWGPDVTTVAFLRAAVLAIIEKP